MALPTAEHLLTPILKIVSKTAGLDEDQIVEAVAKQLRISELDRKELRTDIKSRKRRFDWRVHNALSELSFATAFDEEREDGEFHLTDSGKVLAALPGKLTFDSLKQIPAYAECWTDAELLAIDDDGVWVLKEEEPQRSSRKSDSKTAKEATPPIEIDRPKPADKIPGQSIEGEAEIVAAHRKLEIEFSEIVLGRLKATTPTRFEQIVVDVLAAMGYGGHDPDAVERIGGTGDGGVDGVMDIPRDLFVQFASDIVIGLSLCG